MGHPPPEGPVSDASPRPCLQEGKNSEAYPFVDQVDQSAGEAGIRLIRDLRLISLQAKPASGRSGDGGEGGIRTHGTTRVQRFSRPSRSATPAPLRGDCNSSVFSMEDGSLQSVPEFCPFPPCLPSDALVSPPKFLEAALGSSFLGKFPTKGGCGSGPSVPVAIPASPSSSSSQFTSGSASKALLFDSTARWVYRSMVRSIFECRARSLAFAGSTPPLTRFVMKVCLRAWKSAFRPAESSYGIPASFRSSFNMSAVWPDLGRLKTLAAGSLSRRSPLRILTRNGLMG